MLHSLFTAFSQGVESDLKILTTMIKLGRAWILRSLTIFCQISCSVWSLFPSGCRSKSPIEADDLLDIYMQAWHYAFLVP